MIILFYAYLTLFNIELAYFNIEKQLNKITEYNFVKYTNK